LERASKVANLGPSAFAEEDIIDFDIKMEYLLGMKVLYATADINTYLVC
jgi:hypothetical protein